MANLTLEQFTKKLERWQRSMPDAVKDGLRKGLDIVSAEVETNLSGRVLNRRSGQLFRAIGTELEAYRRPLRAKVFIDNRQQYKAQAHEYGLQTKPGLKLPMRKFMKPAYERNKDRVMDGILQEIMSGYEHS
jgi:hypothetical protein